MLREGGGDIDLTSTIQELESEMLKAAEDLKFEKAALLRDQIKELKRMMDGGRLEGKPSSTSYRTTSKRGNGPHGKRKGGKPEENPF